MSILPRNKVTDAVGVAVQAVDTTEVLNKPDFGGAPDASAIKRKAIFNGKDLKGWKGLEGFWSVKNSQKSCCAGDSMEARVSTSASLAAYADFDGTVNPGLEAIVGLLGRS